MSPTFPPTIWSGNNKRTETECPTPAAPQISPASPDEVRDRAALHKEIAALIEDSAAGTQYEISAISDPMAEVLYTTAEYFDCVRFLWPSDMGKLHQIFSEYVQKHPGESREVMRLLSVLVENAFTLTHNSEVSHVLLRVKDELPKIAKRHGVIV